MPSKVTLNSFLQVFDEKFARGGDWFPHLFLEKFCKEFCCSFCNKYDKSYKYDNSYKYEKCGEYEKSIKIFHYGTNDYYMRCSRNYCRFATTEREGLISLFFC